MSQCGLWQQSNWGRAGDLTDDTYLLERKSKAKNLGQKIVKRLRVTAYHFLP